MSKQSSLVCPTTQQESNEDEGHTLGEGEEAGEKSEQIIEEVAEGMAPVEPSEDRESSALSPSLPLPPPPPPNVFGKLILKFAATDRSLHYGPEQPKILGHSLVRSLARSLRSPPRS